MHFNICGYPGYLTKEDRLRPIAHKTTLCMFESNTDLSSGIKVTSNFIAISSDDYANNVAEFIGWWMLNIYPDLNGFSGLDTISFEHDFLIQD